MFRVFVEDLNAVVRNDPAATSRLETLLCHLPLHAVWAYRVAHFARERWRLPLLPRLLSALARIWTGVEIHPGARIGQAFFIDHGTGVVIGETAEIGDHCVMFHNVTLGGTGKHRGKRHPTVCDNHLARADYGRREREDRRQLVHPHARCSAGLHGGRHARALDQEVGNARQRRITSHPAFGALDPGRGGCRIDGESSGFACGVSLFYSGATLLDRESAGFACIAARPHSGAALQGGDLSRRSPARPPVSRFAAAIGSGRVRVDLRRRNSPLLARAVGVESGRHRIRRVR